MQIEYHPNQKFKIVSVVLLVPNGEESYLDLLSSHRDDNPDQLVQFISDVEQEGLSRDQVIEAWKTRARDESVRIKLQGDT